MSPHFLEACHYAKELGYWSVQAATNGIRFVLEPEFAEQAKEAGLNMVYLQFDGVTNASNAHRHIENLFDAKRIAIERIFEAGMDITPVTTVVNTVNDEQVGPILDFMIDNSDMIGAVSFQPVSFTGRDEEIGDAERHQKRYTVSHLAHELSRYYDGKIDVYRDFYPLGSLGAFTWLADHLRGPDVQFGGLNCSCHPNCGASLILVVNWQTKEWEPLTAFFDIERFVRDINVITDTSRGAGLSKMQALLAFVRNLDASKMPPGMTVPKFLKLLNRKMGATMSSDVEEDEWNIMWVGGMWFQDLWTYDFRRTEMCVIPYATQEGEISFCAYNTGVGWRQIVESMYQVADTRDWFQEKGRHQIYAAWPSDAAPPGGRAGGQAEQTERGSPGYRSTSPCPTPAPSSSAESPRPTAARNRRGRARYRLRLLGREILVGGLEQRRGTADAAAAVPALVVLLREPRRLDLLERLALGDRARDAVADDEHHVAEAPHVLDGRHDAVSRDDLRLGVRDLDEEVVGLDRAEEASAVGGVDVGVARRADRRRRCGRRSTP